MARTSLFLFPPLLYHFVDAYSFSIETTPKQCSTLQVSVSGGGTPPYRLSIIPYGGTPPQLSFEVRKVIDLQFNDSTQVSFTLPYPTNSQFVAVVSDNNASGSSFGSGGVTVPVNVVSGGPDSCLPKAQVSPAFVFGLDPVGSLTTCQSSSLTWDASTVQGDVKFWGIIPGGNAFVIPGNNVFQDNGKSAVSFTPEIRPGVNVLLVAGDNRGFGAGGSFQGSMQPGNGTTSCIDSSSPALTSGSPAGGSYPTDSGGDTTTSGGSSPNIGAIVGGVIGGVAAIAIFGILIFFLLRRSRQRRANRRFEEKPVDLLEGRPTNEDGDGNAQVPHQYLPEPFHIPESSRGEGPMSEASQETPATAFARDRRHSDLSLMTSTEASSGMPLSNRTGKSGAPSQLRPVNIIQHDDAGPSEAPLAAEGEQAETVELPPAYTNLRK